MCPFGTFRARQGEEVSLQSGGGTYRAGECRKWQVHVGKTLGVRRLQRSLSGALHEYPWRGAYSIWRPRALAPRRRDVRWGHSYLRGGAGRCGHWPSQRSRPVKWCNSVTADAKLTHGGAAENVDGLSNDSQVPAVLREGYHWRSGSEAFTFMLDTTMAQASRRDVPTHPSG